MKGAKSWWPQVYWVMGCIFLFAAPFVPSDETKHFAILLGLVFCLRGDTLALRDEMNAWRRM